MDELEMMRQRVSVLEAAIKDHHSQRADDRCFLDDDRLYTAAGLPPCDRRVGDKAAMLHNCERFIDRRCEGGGWPSYAEIECERDRLRVLAMMMLVHMQQAKQSSAALCLFESFVLGEPVLGEFSGEQSLSRLTRLGFNESVVRAAMACVPQYAKRLQELFGPKGGGDG